MKDADDDVVRVEGPDQRHVRRITRRGFLGAVLGAMVGAGIGLIAGIANFGAMVPVVACGLAGAVAGGGLGMFVGGMTGLESPEPGREPSRTNRPVIDIPELTEVEPTRRAAPRPRARRVSSEDERNAS
jgi:hypothetical protein